MALEKFDEGTRAEVLKFVGRYTTFGRGAQAQPLTAMLHELLPLLAQYGINSKYDGFEEEWYFGYRQTRVRALFHSGQFRVFVSKPEDEHVEVSTMPELDFDPTMKQFLGPVIGRDLSQPEAPPVRKSAHESLVSYILGLLA